MRLVIGISGATGSIYGIRMLEALQRCAVETHLVLTDSAKRTIDMETDHLPQTLDDIINQTVGKALDQFDIEHDLFRRWTGEGKEKFKPLAVSR